MRPACLPLPFFALQHPDPLPCLRYSPELPSDIRLYVAEQLIAEAQESHEDASALGEVIPRLCLVNKAWRVRPLPSAPGSAPRGR